VTIEDLKIRIDQLVDRSNQALRDVTRNNTVHPCLKSEDWAFLRSAGLSFIETTFGTNHSYYIEFNKVLDESYESNGKKALGVLSAIQEQINGGWIEKTRGLVTADVFADFLEMAEHLLNEKYKDAAAVMIGGVLEGHLRELCLSKGISIELDGVSRKADGLNSDLAREGKYTILDQKSVTAWLDLRNKAAHGKYSEYAIEQVALMLAGVRDFISRVRP
jgi:hypothetical protein